MRIVRACLDTRNFSFDAYGLDEDDAKTALLMALDKHRRQYMIAKDWAAEYLPNIQIRHVETGKGYRDRELIA